MQNKQWQLSDYGQSDLNELGFKAVLFWSWTEKLCLLNKVVSSTSCPEPIITACIRTDPYINGSVPAKLKSVWMEMFFWLRVGKYTDSLKSDGNKSIISPLMLIQWQSWCLVKVISATSVWTRHSEEAEIRMFENWLDQVIIRTAEISFLSMDE